jgi:hypothetical protein
VEADLADAETVAAEHATVRSVPGGGEEQEREDGGARQVDEARELPPALSRHRVHPPPIRPSRHAILPADT